MRKTETPAATELRDRARAAPARWTDAVAVGDWDRVERELYDLHWALDRASGTRLSALPPAEAP